MSRLVPQPKVLAWGVSAFIALAGLLALAGEDAGELWRKPTGPAAEGRPFETGSQPAEGRSAAPESKASSGWAPPAEIADKLGVVERRSAAEDMIWQPPKEIAEPESQKKSPASE